MKIRITRALILILMISVFVHADTGETGAGFLTLDAGAQSIGMGGAVTTLSSGADALFWNPGNLSWLNNTEILIAHSEHFESIRHEHFGIAHRLPFMRMGFSLKGFFVSGLEERTGPSQNPISSFGAYSAAPGVTVAFPVGKKLGFGANIKAILQNIATENAFSVAGDIGMSTIDIAGGLRLGIVLNDIGTGVTFVDQTFSLPTRVSLGIGYVTAHNRLLCEAGAVKPFKDDIEFRCGLAAMPITPITLRVGYRSGLSVNGGMAGFAGGVGFRVSALVIDYATALYGDLGLTHNLSLKYIVGAASTRGDDEERIAQELAKRAKLTAETFYNQGVTQQNAGKFEEALQYYDMALIWYPDYVEATQAAKNIDKRINEIKISEYLARGIAEFRSARYIEAILEFGNILAIDSTHAQAKEWMNASTNAMVKMHMEKVQHEQTVQNKIARHLEQGLSYYGKGQFKEAIGEWNKIIILDPVHQEAQAYISKARTQITQVVNKHLSNAQSLMKQQKWMEAYRAVNEVLSLDPQNQDARTKLAAIQTQLRDLSIRHTQDGIQYYKRGEYADAETEFKMALYYESSNVTAKNYLEKMKPQGKPVSGGDVKELYMKGVNAYTQEKYQLAIQYWKRVLEIDPNHTNAQRNIKRAEEKLKIQ
ncbi:PorV/PorQ family protein [candidate division WOR-3 bacterium]|nr:PorV/PorQ family protein [candidate division WOR-3 bacterium]